jgi:SAM-dependent methyltransferase
VADLHADARRQRGICTPTEKPYSAACERNRDPILRVLRSCFADRRRVLEIGSGTGQHAAYFSAALPHLIWQASDRAENLPGIRQWLADVARPSTPGRSPSAPEAMDGREGPPPPLEFDVDRQRSPGDVRTEIRYDACFSANTLHIMSWPEVEKLFGALSELTTGDAKLAIYGPFNYGGRYTSVSNADFDRSLKERAPHMGIRDVGAVDALAHGVGFDLIDDVAMPANNRCRVWQRVR